ncbi:MAG: hypothetical protein ACE361_24150 [Aureliella sp.]
MPRHFASFMSVLLMGFSLGGIPANIGTAQDPFGESTSENDPFGFGSDDPFGGQGDTGGMDVGNAGAGFGNFGAAAAPDASAVAPANPGDAPDPDPIVRMLRESPPTNPKEMAQGLTWMARIQRWDEVRRLLTSVSSLNWNTSQLAELSRAAGPGLWFRIRKPEAGLDEAQSAMVAKILKAPAAIAQNPKWIDAWVNRLSTSKAGEQRLAQLKLQDAGHYAVQRLVAHLLDGDTKVDPSVLAETILLFEQDGEDALRSACGVDNAERAARVFSVLPSLKTNRFTAEIAVGLQSSRLSEEVKKAIGDQLMQKYGQLPSPERVHEFVSKEFDNRLVQYFQDRVQSTKLPVRVWQVAADGDSIEAIDGDSASRALGQLELISTLRAQLLGGDRDADLECAVAFLQSSYQRTRSVVSKRISFARLPSLESRSDDANFWRDVYQRASSWQMHGAALRALQTVPSNDPDVTATLGFLSKLLYDTRPVIRYTALKTIGEIDPQIAYRGSEQALVTAIEMSRLGSGPRSLVMGLSSDLLQAARQQIQSATAGDVTIANSAQAALMALDQENPYELIFIVDRVSDQRLFEVMQRLRNTKRGQALPMAVLVTELYRHETDWMERNGGVVKGALTSDPTNMQRVIGQMLGRLDTEPMSIEDRSAFAFAAKQFLTRITANQEQYPFYVLGDYREQLVSTTASSGAGNQLNLLGGLGTRESQMDLVRIAANPSKSETQRMEAAGEFEKSIRRYGILLSEASLADCYEMYNALGPKDPIVVKAVGRILDIIEAQEGKRDWPAGMK